MKHALILSLSLFLSCSDESGAREALQDAGYTNIQMRGYRNACHHDDATCTEFTAQVPGSDKLAHGVVGCSRGLGCKAKSCTIRILGR